MYLNHVIMSVLEENSWFLFLCYWIIAAAHNNIYIYIYINYAEKAVIKKLNSSKLSRLNRSSIYTYIYPYDQKADRPLAVLYCKSS